MKLHSNTKQFFFKSLLQRLWRTFEKRAPVRLQTDLKLHKHARGNFFDLVYFK